MKPGLTISFVGHAGVLLWGLLAFAAKPNEAPPADALPVEFISAKEFSQLTAGVKNAPQPIEKAMPLVDKVGDPKLVNELAPRAADKPEITTNAATPESKPPLKPARRRVAKVRKAEPKPTEKAEKSKTPKARVDEIAQELKKEETKRPSKAHRRAEKKPPEFKPDQISEELKKDEAKSLRRKHLKPTPKFDANEVAALLDKREPRRRLASGATLNNVAALGAASAHAAVLSQSELDALRAKLISLWNPPVAVSANPDQYVVTIRIRLTRDYRLAGSPQVLTSGDGPLFEATRESAVRAVLQAQPYDMLSQSTYDQWKDITVTFNPREVFGG